MYRMGVDQELVDATAALMRGRFGPTPWAGAAAMCLDDGSIVTSTAPDAINDAVALCHETGALCDAFKAGKAVVSSVCVVQPSADQILVLAPCGVCQERLFVYGPSVEVGVPDGGGGPALGLVCPLDGTHFALTRWPRSLSENHAS